MFMIKEIEKVLFESVLLLIKCQKNLIKKIFPLEEMIFGKKQDYLKKKFVMFIIHKYKNIYSVKKNVKS